uniref:penicillin acylase family protein n=1 Tax=Aquiflexum sp. TaxID=1872584 RepID=UPI0035948202
MRYFGFLLVFSVTLALGVALSLQIGTVPPLGKLLDPHHGFWQNSYSEDQFNEEEIKLPGLMGTVKVVYDENLIPHIFAENEEDLYRVQGYVTAQHRLWQMEFQTMAAAGRISEIVGPIALEIDRMTRRKGLSYSAEISETYIQNNHQETYRLLVSYAEGVNQYIQNLKDSRLPIEYKILDYRPESWSPYKTLLLLKYMSDMLAKDRDLEYTNLRNQFGKELMDRLYPDFPEENDPIIEADRIWDFEPLKIDVPDSIVYPDADIFVKALPQPFDGIGSNNWAVSGSKTKNGNPILANDP